MRQAASKFTILLDRKITAITRFELKRSTAKLLVKLGPSYILQHLEFCQEFSPAPSQSRSLPSGRSLFKAAFRVTQPFVDLNQNKGAPSNSLFQAFYFCRCTATLRKAAEGRRGRSLAIQIIATCFLR